MLGSVKARQLRIEFTGDFSHVTSRGNERKAIFKSQHDTGRKLKEIGTYFDIGESRVLQTTRRVSDKLKKDKKLTRKINRIKNKFNL
ncbi:MAG: hypothetical protein KAQ71_16930 [Desulfobulbaceae bacterium]|nr:hypothetical protein [Desulfobulbaceae bacterium]